MFFSPPICIIRIFLFLHYIKDAEFDAFLEIDFEERFEEDLKSTPIGIRILMLQKMGLDINLKKITQKQDILKF